MVYYNNRVNLASFFNFFPFKGKPSEWTKNEIKWRFLFQVKATPFCPNGEY